MLPFFSLLALALAAMACSGCGQKEEQDGAQSDRETLYQVSTYGALKAGFHDGDVSHAEAGGRGDTGIGTFEGPDGEMVALDGTFYQVRTDGKVYPADGSFITPFAMVTFFDADSEARP